MSLEALAMPDLDLIKQGEQGVRDRRGRSEADVHCAEREDLCGTEFDDPAFAVSVPLERIYGV